MSFAPRYAESRGQESNVQFLKKNCEILCPKVVKSSHIASESWLTRFPRTQVGPGDQEIETWLVIQQIEMWESQCHKATIWGWFIAPIKLVMTWGWWFMAWALPHFAVHSNHQMFNSMDAVEAVGKCWKDHLSRQFRSLFLRFTSFYHGLPLWNNVNMHQVTQAAKHRGSDI